MKVESVIVAFALRIVIEEWSFFSKVQLVKETTALSCTRTEVCGASLNTHSLNDATEEAKM